MTGYIFPKSSAVPSKLSGITWLDQGNNPTNSNFFTVPVSTRGLDYDGQNYARVENLFSSDSARGYTFGTGGTPIKANDGIAIYFTGFSGTQPMYLSYLYFVTGGNKTVKQCLTPLEWNYPTYVVCPEGTTPDAANFSCPCSQYVNIPNVPTSGAYSIMSGIVSTTEFSRPSGYYTHSEIAANSSAVPSNGVGYRLQPNGFYPQTGSGIGAANFGGAYPALGFDNGMVTDLAISWQSVCPPGTSNCVDPI